MKILHFDLNDTQSIYLQSKEALEETGAVVLRGLKLDQLRFESLTKLFCQNFFRVTSRETHRQIYGDGFTTVAPPENYTLLGHSEVQYVPCIRTPDLGFFFCQTAPEVSGGETFLIDGSAMFQSLSLALQYRFIHENIIYEFLWETQRWQAQYNVETEEQLHKVFKAIKNIRYTLKDGWLHMFYTTSGIAKFKDGSIAFSNAILAHLPYIDYPAYSGNSVYTKETNHIYWENGEAFSTETVNQLIDVHDHQKQLHVWEKNDLLIFDNFRYLHGREKTVEFSERTLLTRFGHLNVG